MNQAFSYMTGGQPMQIVARKEIGAGCSIAVLYAPGMRRPWIAARLNARGQYITPENSACATEKKAREAANRKYFAHR